MRPGMRRPALAPLAALAVLAGALAALALPAVLGLHASHAQEASARPDEAGPRWSELTAAQRQALKPLERDWTSIEADRKRKWMDIAARMPNMPPAERERVQARMSEWARKSPQERGETRQRYQEARQASPSDRQAQWEAYQALPPERKRQFQARAVPPAPAPVVRSPSTRPDGGADKVGPKSNIVPNPAYAAPPKPVAPTVVQAQPGATTSLIGKRPTPPAHQQTGLPKIAATPDFVDRTTLLPRRGPQAAATRSAASAPVPAPARRAP